MARYGQAFKDRAVARLLPPESSPVEVVSREIGVSVQTLERWRSDALLQPTQQRQGGWTVGRVKLNNPLDKQSSEVLATDEHRPRK